MNPDPKSQPIQGKWRARRPRRWISMAGLMLLIGIIAVGLAVADYWRRVRVVIYNDRGESIYNVRLEYSGHQAGTAEIASSEFWERRISTSLSNGPIRVSYETMDLATNPVRRRHTMTKIDSGLRDRETLYVQVVPAGHTFATTRR